MVEEGLNTEREGWQQDMKPTETGWQGMITRQEVKLGTLRGEGIICPWFFGYI